VIFTAFQFAPASHAAIFPAASTSLMGMLLAAAFLADRLGAAHILGAAMVVLGLSMLWRLLPDPFDSGALIGDLLFILAGAMWAGLFILLRKYQLDALLATSVTSFLALITYGPIYLYATGATTLRAATTSLAWTEVLVQGVLAGACVIYASAKTVQMLGASRAAIFRDDAGAFHCLQLDLPGRRAQPGDAPGLAMAMAGLIVAALYRERPCPPLPDAADMQRKRFESPVDANFDGRL
jgi:drug/metabolite transporter (DMT)-like permease